MNIKVFGFGELQRAMRALGDELPAAIASGLNRTIEAVERHELVAMERSLDRPTPFTMNALQVWKAKPSRLDAVLQVRPLQAKYIRYTVEGGTLKKNITPVTVRLNRFGNVVGMAGGLKGIATRGKNRFVATINGTTGVWARYGRGGRRVRLLAYVESNARRTARWDFTGVAESVVQRRLASDVRREVENARQA